MKHILYLILEMLMVFLMSATTVSIMTVKPAIPKATIVVSGWTTDALNNEMKPYLKQGYVVKNLSVGYGCRAVIMEKY